MNRIKFVQDYVNSIFDNIIKPAERRAAYIHSYGVAQSCALLAQRKELDVEIATAIGLLHDIYFYKTGVHSLHAHNGAEMVRVALKNQLNNLFSGEQQIIIKSAIYHHTDKEHLHDEYDELIKDCDTLQHYLFDASAERYISKRLVQAAAQFSITLLESIQIGEKKTPPFYPFRVGDIAEELAQKKITGTKDNAGYMEIIKYYPEITALSELDHAWCAAFVYHCCVKAGLALPLRTPHHAKRLADCRFACVAAWYDWAKEHGYCFYENNSFHPQRGDIVIYNHIIPKEDKPEGSAWCDHIGIVLSCAGDMLTVAEGNVGNQNMSDILKRRRNDTIGCYVRIPTDYEYDGWRIDYKTGKVREEPYIK